MDTRKKQCSSNPQKGRKGEIEEYQRTNNIMIDLSPNMNNYTKCKSNDSLV